MRSVRGRIYGESTEAVETRTRATRIRCGKFKGVQSGGSWTPAHSKSVKRRAGVKVSRTHIGGKIPCVTRCWITKGISPLNLFRGSEIRMRQTAASSSSGVSPPVARYGALWSQGNWHWLRRQRSPASNPTSCRLRIADSTSYDAGFGVVYLGDSGSHWRTQSANSCMMYGAQMKLGSFTHRFSTKNSFAT